MIFQSPNIVEKAIDEVIPYVNNPRNNQAAVELAPNLDAIKYIRESKKQRIQRYDPCLTSRAISGDHE